MKSSRKPLSILTFGSAVIDVIVVVDDERIEEMKMTNAGASFLLLEAGRKIVASSISRFFGGGAVNSAVGLARQGHRVSALVKLGADPEAERVLEHLQQENIDTSCHVRDATLATGSSVLISSHSRNATIFTYRGANTTLLPDDLQAAAFEGRDLVYVTALSNASADQFGAILSQAKSAGAMTAANPGVRQISTRGTAIVEALENLDLLTLNRLEAGMFLPCLSKGGRISGPALTMPDGTVVPRLAGGGFEAPISGYIRAVQALGPRYVVVTDGGNGAFLGAPDGQIYHCGILKTEVKGTAGAGDAFASTLSGQLAAEVPVEQALRIATCNAASVVGAVDTQTGLLGAEDLLKRAESFMHQLPIATWEAR